MFASLPGRLRGALIDPARRERMMLSVLAVYVALWTAYGTIAKGPQGLHPDMTEMLAWSRDLAWGYDKHPPLGAAVVWLWFHVFPVAEWSYYLLAMLMPALALWIVWRLSADYLDGEKRVVGVALLTLVPFFNFHALKFNANTVLLPLWAAATFFFLRSYRTRSAGYAALAGIAAAACMLGKYWSVMLLAGLAVAALIDSRRAAYFRSPAPWITIAAGLIVLAPHLAWLVQHDFSPLTYAANIHAAKPLGESVLSAFGYLAGSTGYVAVPVAIVLVMARPNRALLADMAWPAERERRLAAAAFWAPLLLPAVAAPLTGTEITSLWSMSALSLLLLLLLSPPSIAVRAVDTRRILAAAVALPVLALIASPIVAIMAQRAGPQPAGAHARLLAQEIERQWLPVTPLLFIGGDGGIAYAVASYAHDAPRALPGLLPPTDAELVQGGLVLICFAEDAACKSAATAKAAAIGASRVVVTTITRNFLGFAGKPQGYAIIIVPPKPNTRAGSSASQRRLSRPG